MGRNRAALRLAPWALIGVALLGMAACGGGGTGAPAFTEPPQAAPLLFDVQAPEVPDVVPKLLSIRGNGEWLGFHLEGGPTPTASFDEATDTIVGSHWQSITRFESDDLPWLALSIDADDPAEPEPDDAESDDAAPAEESVEPGAHAAGVAFVRMGSRTERNGERMRSNRQQPGQLTQDTAPEAADVQQSFLELPETYQCPGGMQALGDLLLVANTNKEPAEDADPLVFPDGHHASTSVVQFVDISDPTSPVVLDYELPVEVDSSSHDDDTDTTAERSRIGTVGITQAADGHFLLAVMSLGGHHLHVYRSTADSYEALLQNVRSALPGDDILTLVDSWFHTEAAADVTWPIAQVAGGGPTGAFQMANLLTQSGDGHICLLGGRNTNAHDPFDGDGTEELKLYDLAVDVDAGTVAVLNPLVGATRVPVSKVISLEAPGAGHHGTCNAGAGLYVSPSRELICYVVEHASVQLDPAATAFVRFSELRHEEVVQPDSPLKDAVAALGVPEDVDRERLVLDEGEEIPFDAHDSTPSRIEGWVELFAETDFGGRSIVLDLADFANEDWQDLSLQDGPAGVGFGAVARSVRWYLPRGSNIQLFADAGYPALGNRLVLPLPAAEFDGTPEAEEWIAMEVSEGFVGDVQVIADLSAFMLFEPVADGLALTSTPADDVIRSVRFDPDAELAAPVFDPHTWTLAPASPFGALTSLDAGKNSVRFDAVDDDGSPEGAAVEVILGVDDGFDTSTDTVSVAILNVAPALETLPDLEDVECPADVTIGPVIFSDPGVLDTHAATVDWGDDSDPQDLGAVQSGFESAHRYDMPGLYTVTIKVEDDDGGTDQTEFTVEVVDTIPPEVITDTRLDTLWSPNHVMTDVGFSYEVEDLCDPAPSIVVRVYTDEPEDGSPPKAPDVEMDEAPDMELRPEREGQGDGRVYLIVVTGTDASGNRAFATATVVVPHSQSQKAKDDVDAQAAAAVLSVEASDGEIPSGFTEIGDFVIQ